METLRPFFWGALAMGSLVIALHFLRYWRNTGDALFAWFSVAFLALGLNWIALAVVNPGSETRHILYLLRLLAFLLIIVGIVSKNRRAARI